MLWDNQPHSSHDSDRDGKLKASGVWYSILGLHTQGLKNWRFAEKYSSSDSDLLRTFFHSV